MTDAELEHWMHLAIRLSERGFPAPNPQVGCVIVKHRRLVGAGHHEYAGGPHAEVMALRRAGVDAKGATAFVTLEPCNHTGRTPPCTDALIDAGVSQVVIACEDPNPAAAGGVERLIAHGKRVVVGVLADEAEGVNRRWLIAMRRKRPFVAIKAAITLDGFLARPDGSSKWITGPRARRVGHALRAQMGSVLVGRRTVEHDDPQLTARLPTVRRQPTRIVLDPQARLTGAERAFRGPGETIRVVADGRAGGMQVSVRDGSFDLSKLASQLFVAGVTSVLVEGGAATIGAFLQARMADEVHLFVAPRTFGAGIPWTGNRLEADLKFRFVTSQRVGPDLWIMAHAMPHANFLDGDDV